MTSARRRAPPHCARVHSARLPRIFGLLVILALAWPGASNASLTERIVVDPLTGLALSGFDPVAYFSLREPRRGIGPLELPYGGAIWRFRNVGNRAAFVQHPEVYMPRFGGHDPVALGRGVAMPGHPLIWLVLGKRLYLFSSEENRSAFLANPERTLVAAERGWREVEPTLVP